MTDWSRNLKDASARETVLGGAGIGIAALSIYRIGSGVTRALTLGWKSYFKTIHSESVRKSDLNMLTGMLVWGSVRNYIAVTGRTGIGKTCMINTVLHRRHGVVEISTESRVISDVIYNDALSALTRRHYMTPPDESARRVLFYYNLIFERPPIVVIRVPERQVGHDCAKVHSAATRLWSKFGLTVIVDAAPDSLEDVYSPPTKLYVEPMTRDEIESIPELKDFIGFLKSRNLDGPVWAVLGGSPVDYIKLKEAVYNGQSTLGTNSDDAILGVKSHLLSILYDALNNSIAKCDAKTAEAIRIYRTEVATNPKEAQYKIRKLELNFPNKVLFMVHDSGYWSVEPTSTAVALIISENINDDAGV